MDQEAFSQKIGISQDTVRGMVETNKLPSIKIGKRRFVNIAELTSRCLNEGTNR
jgi:excisionase family DNA binding protein